MRCNAVTRILSVLLIAFFVWVFEIALPRFEIRELDMQLGVARAHAADLNIGTTAPPLSTDLSEPGFIMKYSWARLAGREEAVYLNIPGTQLSNTITLPSAPQPIIIAKYDPSTASGTIAVMRMWQGPQGSIRAEILRISPGNFQHFFGMHLYNFAFLNWNPNNDASCNAQLAQKYLRADNPPDTTRLNLPLSEIEREFTEYDSGRTGWDPVYSLRTGLGLEKDKVNRSSLYWHQRLNDDACWQRVALKDFDKSDGNFRDISQMGFYKIVTLAMHLHKANLGFVAVPDIRQSVNQSTKKSAFKKKVTTTVSYYLKPKWTVVTPKFLNSLYSDYVINATNTPDGDYSFIDVKGDHSFPVDETLIYQWSQTKSGWTGFFVFISVMVVGALLGGLGAIGLTQAGLMNANFLAGALVGGGVGGIGGLVASGFSPTTSTTAHITPFAFSAYQLNPSDAMSGDSKEIASRTFDNWTKPDIMGTPGGVQIFASKLDIRRAALCGGASYATDACSANAASSIVDIPMSDPRFKTIYEEMFSNPSKELMKYKYPYTSK
ncbi:MAG: hypothetical protein M1510_13120 [Nitrospirae bacterium]|nr:hypothetical protein [Nitrospirota bacterium]